MFLKLLCAFIQCCNILLFTSILLHFLLCLTVTAEKEAASLRYRKDEIDPSLKEHGEEISKENGVRRSNGMEADAKSNRTADRQPDVVDDHPGKSRYSSRSYSQYL